MPSTKRFQGKRNRLLIFFEFLVEKVGKERRLRICVSSRHYPIISPLSKDSLVVNVESENNHDIETYISHTLLHGVSSWDIENDTEKGELEGILLAKAAGVFLWVKLRLEKIVKGLNDGVFEVKEVKDMLQEETNELSDLYEAVLRNDVGVHLRGNAFLMMRWICLAERPLTLGELRFAIGCDETEDEDTRYEEVKPFVDTDARMEKLVKSLSGGLAEVRYHGKERIVQLFHQSVNDFLRADGLSILHRLSNRSKEDYNDIIGICEDTITRSCLRYLNCKQIFERATIWMKDIPQTYMFIQYATEHWAVHATRAERHNINQEYLVYYFVSYPTLFETWKTIYRSISYRQPKCPNPLAKLIHVTSTFGLETTSMYALKNGATLKDEDDINGLTPLDLAAKYGQDTLVQKYIDLGAVINGEVVGWQTPLEIAAAHNQVSTARLLLRNGAKLEGDVGGNSALGDASKSGNLSLVRLLLEADADINFVRDTDGTALSSAAFEGKEDVVKFLIKYAADVNAKGGIFGCALQAAGFGSKRPSREATINYLVSKGADVNLQGGKYGNPLQAAVVSGNIAIVKFLLKTGADVNAQGGYHGTALQAAAFCYQNTELIQLLLDHGADINVQAGEYNTALQAASATGFEEAVELFIQLKADVNIQGGRYGNALQAAVQYPEGGTTVSLLLQHGAKIESQSGYFGNVLQAAISKGNSKLAKQFLDMGADINEIGGYHGDILQAVFPFCKEEFIGYLLERGAKVNVNGGQYGNPFVLFQK